MEDAACDSVAMSNDNSGVLPVLVAQDENGSMLLPGPAADEGVEAELAVAIASPPGVIVKYEPGEMDEVPPTTMMPWNSEASAAGSNDDSTARKVEVKTEILLGLEDAAGPSPENAVRTSGGRQAGYFSNINSGERRSVKKYCNAQTYCYQCLFAFPVIVWSIAVVAIISPDVTAYHSLVKLMGSSDGRLQAPQDELSTVLDGPGERAVGLKCYCWWEVCIPLLC